MKGRMQTGVQIAEIIGALAIVLSLIFVGFQVRDNTRFARADAASQINTSLSNFYTQLAMDEEASALLFTGLDDFHALSDADKSRFSLLIYSAYTSTTTATSIRNQILTFGNSSVDGNGSIEAPLIEMIRQPGFRQWQESEYRLPAPPALNELIERALADSGN